MKRVSVLAALTLIGSTLLASESMDAKSIYKNRCMICHTTKAVAPEEKGKLLGPPADEVMYHVKERYPEKEKAIAFMVDYIMQPSPDKALCASMEKFGLMPAMKGTLTPEDARTVSALMFDKFPRPDFAKAEKEDRSKITFATLDADGDGFVTPEEFRNFRAKRNNIDPKTFKNDLYFKRIDLNGDGKMDPDEFETMKKARSGR